MVANISMLGKAFQKVIDFFTGIFAFIPQVIYFLYTCFMSLMDVLQFIARKLVGLDVYYIDGKSVSGDIVSDFISGVLGINGNSPRYSALSTVFWSLVVFGCILLVLTTIIVIIKNQYNYDEKKSHPVNIIFESIKTFFLMAIIPITCVIGVTLSNILLQSLDKITSPSSNIQIEQVYKNSSGNYTLIFEEGTTVQGDLTYNSYDFFGARSYTNTATFSGIMFKVAARDANRVRTSAYTPSENSTMGTSDFKWTDFGIFTSTAANEETRREDVAEMIDFAFANCLTLRNKNITASTDGKESAELKSSYVYFESAVWYLGLINVSSFSKYNVGLVWYYYNLWSFNFFLGFAGAVALLIIFGSIIFGLMVRLVRILCLFLIYPPLVGIGPLDNKNAINQWQKQFLKDVLMGYGAIVGLNISFLILDELQKVYFFKSVILNNIMDMVLILALLAVLKDIVKLISGLVGGEDAVGTGGEAMQAAKEVGTSAADAGLKVANIAMKLGLKFTPVGKALSSATKSANKKKANSGAAATKKQKIKQLKDKKPGLQQSLDDEEKLSQQDTGKFAGLMEKNVGKEGSIDAINDFDDFSSDTGDDAAKNIYDNFSKKYADGAADIDADASLSSAEKDERKKALASSLKDEAIRDYSENNAHSVRSKEIMGEMADDDKEIEDLTTQIRDEETARRTEKREGRSRFANALVDLGGATLKAVGDITGVIPTFKKMEKNGSPFVEDTKILGQTLFQELGVVSQTEKIDDGTSKWLTAKQKQKAEIEQRQKTQKAVEKARNESERYNKELSNLAREIQKFKDRGGTI